MWWGEEGAAEGRSAGLGGAGSYRIFQSTAEPRHGCHVCHPTGFMEHWRWRGRARNWDGFPDDGICQENWELWCMMGLLGVCASGSAVEGGGSAL